MSCKILLLGASGFVGQPLYHYLLSQGHEVTRSIKPFAKSEYHNDLRISLENELLECDLSLFNVVIYVATVFPTSERSGLNLFTINTAAICNLIDNLNKSNYSKPPRLIYFSAMSIFRGIGNRNIDENTLPSPNTDYDVSKYASEIVIKRYDLASILRIPFVLEPGCSRSWINKLCADAHSGETLYIRNPNKLYNHITTFRSIFSAIDIIISNTLNPSRPIPKLINLGSKDPISIFDIVNLVKNTIGHDNQVAITDGESNVPLIDIVPAQKLGIYIPSVYPSFECYLKTL